MLSRLNLRLRVFLFFCLLAVAAAGLAGLAMFFGWSRAQTDVPITAFVTAFILFVFLNTGVVIAIWLLFDEHVAKPINRLSAGLRLQAHSGVDKGVDPEDARYLGDLAPAANALTQTVGNSTMDRAAQVAQDTQRLNAEHAKLTELLTEIPLATILLNPALEIVLYDGQAAEVLSRIALPRLRAPIGDYFEKGDLTAAIEQLADGSAEVPFTLRDTAHAMDFKARLKPLGDGSHMVLIDVDSDRTEPIAPRPLVFDFDLINVGEARDIEATSLSDISFVIFDTETTGLSVEKDEIVQLGAVRIVNGHLVPEEVLDTYVNPGRPIPAASTRIHGVSDLDVASAPDIGEVGRAFHHFARGAVLVAHNAPFDIGLLKAASDRMEVEWTHPVLDTVLLSAVVFGTTEEHSLDALCARLGITIPDHERHTALGDAKATAKALVKLLPLLEARGIESFGALIVETRKHGRLLRDLNK